MLNDDSLMDHSLLLLGGKCDDDMMSAGMIMIDVNKNPLLSNHVDGQGNSSSSSISHRAAQADSAGPDDSFLAYNSTQISPPDLSAMLSTSSTTATTSTTSTTTTSSTNATGKEASTNNHTTAESHSADAVNVNINESNLNSTLILNECELIGGAANMIGSMENLQLISDYCTNSHSGATSACDEREYMKHQSSFNFDFIEPFKSACGGDNNNKKTTADDEVSTAASALTTTTTATATTVVKQPLDLSSVSSFDSEFF